MISIGNSRGIRLPKMMLKELEIESEVGLSMESEKIVIRHIDQIWINDLTIGERTSVLAETLAA